MLATLAGAVTSGGDGGFWAVWLALVWHWWSRQEAWAVIALLVWSAQAYFELLTRFELVMSV